MSKSILLEVDRLLSDIFFVREKPTSADETDHRTSLSAARPSNVVVQPVEIQTATTWRPKFVYTYTDRQSNDESNETRKFNRSIDVDLESTQIPVSSQQFRLKINFMTSKKSPEINLRIVQSNNFGGEGLFTQKNPKKNSKNPKNCF